MLATALVLLQIVWSGSELTAPDIAQGRDLSIYDAGGHLDCGRSLHRELFDRVQCIAEARAFISEHWRQRRRGYIRLSKDSVDAHATAHIFIEPDSRGVWRIAWRMAHSGIFRPLALKDLPDTYQLTSLKAEAPEDGTLIFRAADGTEITRL
ncbi:MAG: hypothetical protein ACR2MF_09980 [Chthoniobacterales bacterium]